jgi:DNA-binding MarR family transcriptional regulator
MPGMSTPRARPGRAARRFDSPEQEAFLSLWRTYDRLRALEDELFARFGLTPQQYNALRLLRAEHPDPLPTLALAERLVSRAPDITRMIDLLEQRGLVARTRKPTDRRSVLLAITPAGLALIDEIAGPLRECHARQLGHLSEARLAKLTALLKAARAPHEPDGSPWK